MRFATNLAAVILTLGAATPAFAVTYLSEDFTFGFLEGPGPANGWTAINRSSPVGTTGWFTGDPLVLYAVDGRPADYVSANFNNAAGSGNISNWLISPTFTAPAGARVSFHTFSQGGFADNLQLRLSGTSGTNVGTTATSVGDFTTLLAEINPSLSPVGYPTTWTRYTATLPGAVNNGRLAFRYVVPNSGPLGVNGNRIGIDLLRVQGAADALPTPVMTIPPAPSMSMLSLRDSTAFATVPLTAGQVSWFKIQHTGGTIDFSTTGSSFPGQSGLTANDTLLALYNTEGVRIFINDDAQGSSFSRIAGDLLAGTYYLAASTALSNFAIADFQASSTSSVSGTLRINGLSLVPAFVWKGSSGASWSSSSSWQVSGSAATTPNASDAVAIFPAISGSNVAVNLGSGVTVNKLTFEAPGGYTVGGAGNINIAGTAPAITVTAGNPVLDVTVTASTPVTVSLSAGTRLTLSDQNPGSALPVASLTLGTGAVLDLVNSGLVIDGGDLAQVSTLVASGGIVAGGDGTARDAFSTLAVISNNSGGGFARYVSYRGVPASIDDVLVAYTYHGDTDLNGTVDAFDLNRLMTSLGSSLTGAGWADGDTNRDGVVNFIDFSNLVKSMQYISSGGAPFEPAGTDVSGGAIVPEPGLGLLPLAVAGVLSRRRR